MQNEAIAKIIKAICKEKEITIDKMLKECEIRKNLIYDMEKRDKTPSIEIMIKIADYLKVSLDELTGRKPRAIQGTCEECKNSSAG